MGTLQDTWLHARGRRGSRGVVRYPSALRPWRQHAAVRHAFRHANRVRSTHDQRRTELWGKSLGAECTVTVRARESAGLTEGWPLPRSPITRRYFLQTVCRGRDALAAKYRALAWADGNGWSGCSCQAPVARSGAHVVPTARTLSTSQSSPGRRVSADPARRAARIAPR